VNKEAIQYKHGGHSEFKDHEKYWATAEENSKKISELSDRIVGMIRQRVEEWEKIDV
jgi:hypothetical protein